MTNILEAVAEHVAVVDAAFNVGCAAAACAWQVRLHSLNWDAMTPEQAARESTRVANLVLEAAQAAYIAAVNR